MLQIKMYPAKNGDAFLIKSGDVNVLIDGGYVETFEKYIVSDLQFLSNQGLRLNLVISTHVDVDHISGLIALFTKNGVRGSRSIIEVDEVWHNGLRSISKQSIEDIPPTARNLLESIRRRGYPIPKGVDAQKIGARQGSTLSSLLYRNGYNWNSGDGTRRINAAAPKIPIGESSHVQIIGPTETRLRELQRWWVSELRKKGYKGPFGSGDLLDDAFEFLCAEEAASLVKEPIMISAGGQKYIESTYQPDASITNGSSIAMIIELSGKRLLFLGDSWAEDIVEALLQVRAAGHSLHFDVIKIAHHGSLRNTSSELLNLVDANVYLISSNGQAHGHPNFNVLAAIVDRPAQFQRRLYFNYQTPASTRLRTHRSSTNAEFVVFENATTWIEFPDGKI